jgi:hypothetical protein
MITGLISLDFSAWVPQSPLISWVRAEHPTNPRMLSKITASAIPPSIQPSLLFFRGRGPCQSG